MIKSQRPLPTVFMRYQKGTTLVEIMIAIMVLSVGLVLVITTFTSSLRIQALGAHKLVALNLAREGLEAFRNIRDTNWLVNSGQLRACWNYARTDYSAALGGWIPYGVSNPDNWKAASTCVLQASPLQPEDDRSENPIRAGYYAVQPEYTETMAWILGSYRSLDPLNELSDIEITAYPQSRTEIGDSNYTAHEYLLVPVSPESTVLPYAYVHPDTLNLPTGMVLQNQTTPRYFRQIRIRYLCDEPSYSTVTYTMTEETPTLNDGYPISDTGDCATKRTDGADYGDRVARDDNRMEVTSVVKWYEAGKVYEVRMMTHLTDWKGRKGHDS